MKYLLILVIAMQLNGCASHHSTLKPVYDVYGHRVIVDEPNDMDDIALDPYIGIIY